MTGQTYWWSPTQFLQLRASLSVSSFKPGIGPDLHGGLCSGGDDRLLLLHPRLLKCES